MENTSIQNNNTTEWNGNVSYTLNIIQPVTYQRYISIVAVYCVIMCVSVVGNSLVVAVVYRNENKRMRTTTNYFIVNMSCSDLFRTVFNIPLTIARLNSEHNVLLGETLGNILCKLSELLFFLSIFVSLLSLGVITVDRFLFVFYPYKTFITAKRARILIGTMWLIGIIFTAPLAAKGTIHEYRHVKVCTIKTSTNPTQAYIITCSTVFVVLPLATMVVLYSSVVVKLFQQKITGENSNVNREHLNKRNKKVLVMLVTIVILALVCWLPYWLAELDCILPSEFASCKSVLYLQVLSFANCALNPCVYAIFNERFRDGFYRVLCLLFCPSWVRSSFCLLQVSPE